MMHVRVWRTMTMVTVEVTCHHGQGQTDPASHLLYREAFEVGSDDGPLQVLDVLGAATWSVSRLAFEDELPGLTDECGWS